MDRFDGASSRRLFHQAPNLVQPIARWDSVHHPVIVHRFPRHGLHRHYSGLCAVEDGRHLRHYARSGLS